MKPHWISATVIVAALTAMSFLGSRVTKGNKEWYRTLDLPSFNPPDYVFGVAWTSIYILVGIAAWRLWNLTDHDGRFWWIAGIAAVNAILNVSWSYVFFGAHLLWPAVMVSAGLWLTILALIVIAWPRDLISAVLLVPYLLWVGFATFLNGTIAVQNT